VLTLVSNIPVGSDQVGHGNQSHLIYAANQQRWWLFYFDSILTTVVKTMVSSSADLTTATWSPGASSPAFASGTSLGGGESRNLAVLYLPGTVNPNDVVHVSVGILRSSSIKDTEHTRAAFVGTSSIAWDVSGWIGAVTTPGAVTDFVLGNALGVSSTGYVHTSGVTLDTAVTPAYKANVRIAASPDTGATWTPTFNSPVRTDSVILYHCNVYALFSTGSGKMLVLYDNTGTGAEPLMSDVRYNTYSSGTSWPTSGGANVFTTAFTQDQNDWCGCRVDDTHIYCLRKTAASGYGMSMWTGSAWVVKTAPPTQTVLGGSGIFLATDGTNLWAFVLDSATNQPVRVNKYTVATDTWGVWTQQEAAGASTRGMISGCPYAGNGQIGILFTQTNGSNIDIGLSVLVITPPLGVDTNYVPPQYQRGVIGVGPAAFWQVGSQPAIEEEPYYEEPTFVGVEFHPVYLRGSVLHTGPPVLWQASQYAMPFPDLGAPPSLIPYGYQETISSGPISARVPQAAPPPPTLPTDDNWAVPQYPRGVSLRVGPVVFWQPGVTWPTPDQGAPPPPVLLADTNYAPPTYPRGMIGLGPPVFWMKGGGPAGDGGAPVVPPYVPPIAPLQPEYTSKVPRELQRRRRRDPRRRIEEELFLTGALR
jgi:hypothetical protein